MKFLIYTFRNTISKRNPLNNFGETRIDGRVTSQLRVHSMHYVKRQTKI